MRMILHRALQVLVLSMITMQISFSQVTPIDADSDGECGPDCFDLFSWSPQQDADGDNLPFTGDGIAETNSCNTIIEAEVEYAGNDLFIDLSGTTVSANNQGTDPWTDTWTYTFGNLLTNPILQLSSAFGDTQVAITDCDGVPIVVRDISSGAEMANGMFMGNDEVQLLGMHDCFIVTLMNDVNDFYSLSVGTCLGANPPPPCEECAENESFEYISLGNADFSGAMPTADVFLDGIQYGTATVLFSNLSISEDLAGTAFGAFADGDDMEETFILEVSLCEAITVQQLDVLGLETESQVWVGTCLLYTSPSPRDLSTSRMPSSA